MPKNKFDVLIDGLLFPESPRWRNNSLWLSEKRAGRVLQLAINGSVIQTIQIEGEPGGLGWLPDSSLICVSMQSRSLMRINRQGVISSYVDLSSLTTFRCNDMVIDKRGRAYVGDFGYDMSSGHAPSPGVLVLVPLGGEAPRIVADQLHFPNGCAITPDGETLIVAESAANRLSAFTIDHNGDLTDRQIFADLGTAVPDGICLDDEGAVWLADPIGNAVIRVAKGGNVLERIPTSQGAFACELGGHDGRTLFVCTYDAKESTSATPASVGRLEATVVSVPRAM